jgi:hypothetical protein
VLDDVRNSIVSCEAAEQIYQRALLLSTHAGLSVPDKLVPIDRVLVIVFAVVKMPIFLELPGAIPRTRVSADYSALLPSPELVTVSGQQ